MPKLSICRTPNSGLAQEEDEIQTLKGSADFPHPCAKPTVRRLQAEGSAE